MRTLILLAYLAAFTISIGSFITIALFALSNAIVSHQGRVEQFWLSLALGLAIAVFVGYRFRNSRWPQLTAIIVGPLIGLSFHWIGEDLQTKSPRPGVAFAGLSIGNLGVSFRGLMIASGLWFVSGNLGIVLRSLDNRNRSTEGSSKSHD